MTDEWHTTNLGDWGLGTRQKCTNDNRVDDVPPMMWQALTQGWVFVASDVDEWNIANACWIIGLDTSEDLVPFLRKCGNAAFRPDEDDYDGSQESYEQSVEDLIRKYLVDTIAYHTDISTLCATVEKLLPEGYRADQADWRFETVASFYDGRPCGRRLDHLLLKFPDGYHKRINLS